MKISRPLFFLLLFLFFFLSGVAGLIYESIWSHYLKLYVGHAAYAQTLVLVIYMGGMALGAWIASHFNRKIKHLLPAFALAEVLIGLSALIFHQIFTAYLSFSYDIVFPALNSASLISLYKWGTVPLLILIQTIFLGATFPLMSSGIIRRYNDSPGRIISILYFVNSLGGSIGVLLSGFYLIDKLTIPGTVKFAGIIDIVVGVGVFAVYLLSMEQKPLNAKVKFTGAVSKTGAFVDPVVWIMLIATAGSAAASFIYEVGWIRMLSLVLGSSTHSFELMLSAFIFGLALGGFWIRNRLDTIKNPVATLAKIQVAMGICAIITLTFYSNLFYFMKFLLSTLSRTDQGYLMFHIYSHLICLILMLPATILAGMTLPLITWFMYNRTSDDSMIGKVYALNTLGSIVGVLIAVHLLMPLAGLKYLLITGGALDMAVGIFLLVQLKEYSTRKLFIALSTFSLVAIFLPAMYIKLNPSLLSSGVYRFGNIHKDMVNIYYKDGKTSSVSLSTRAGCYSLANNGKPDASVSIDSTKVAPDEHTQILLAAYPLSYARQCENVGIIGLGSGMTASIMLECDSVKNLDVIEIEPFVVEAAKRMGPKVQKVFSDKRSNIHIDDAKTFFSARRKQYDIIISEPSNPWVSGVAGLFSVEFFKLVSKHLRNDGMLVQWLHLYESKPELVVSILASLGSTFADYKVFESGSDLIILASNSPILQTPVDRLFLSSKLVTLLRAISVEHLNDLHLKCIGSKKVLSLLAGMFEVPVNSDYNPILDLQAEKARFVYSNADEFSTMGKFIIPVRKILEGDTVNGQNELCSVKKIQSANPNNTNLHAVYDAWQTWLYVTSYRNHNQAFADSVVSRKVAFKTAQIRMLARDSSIAAHQIWPKYVLDVLKTTIPYLSYDMISDIWKYIDEEGKGVIIKEDSKDLFAVLRSITDNDFEKVYSISLKYVNTKIITNEEYTKMFAAAYLLSSIKLERFQYIQDVWNTIGGLKYDFNLLILYNYAYHENINRG